MKQSSIAPEKGGLSYRAIDYGGGLRYFCSHSGATAQYEPL